MDQATDYILENVTIPSLSYADILKHSFDIIATNQRGFFDLQAELIEINFGLFNNPSIPNFPFVSLAQRGNSLLLSCHCQVLKRSCVSIRFRFCIMF